MIQIKNVKKTFNKTEVLKGVNIDIERVRYSASSVRVVPVNPLFFVA